VLIGRLTGFLAVAKSPSARSDNLIFAYGEVPRALDLAIRVTALMSGVVRTLKVNEQRMSEELDGGYTQATDLCEFITVACGVDYRSAYDVVGKAVREASRRGIPGSGITGALLDSVARAETGRSWGLAEKDLSAVLDPRAIVESRVGVGGAAPGSVAAMVTHCMQSARELDEDVRRRVEDLDDAERRLLERARRLADSEQGP
jgi:argininosuccinate lyase